VYCLGLCAQSPSMMLNGTLHAKVSPAKFDALLAEALASTEVAA
jgi:formate dehydrogenase subunit gamma